jgi:hypothetical protein
VSNDMGCTRNPSRCGVSWGRGHDVTILRTEGFVRGLIRMGCDVERIREHELRRGDIGGRSQKQGQGHSIM